MDQDIEQPEDMETIVSGPEELAPEEDFSTVDDEWESLREKSTRTSDIYDDLYAEDSGITGAIRGFSPSQRLILGVLFLIDVIACACAALFIAGRI